MSWDQSTDDDMESFFQWVEQTAAAEGVSEKELVDQMTSYYWIFNELSKTLDEETDSQDISDVGALSSALDSAAPEETASPDPPDEDGHDESPSQADTTHEEGAAAFKQNIENLEEFVQALQELRQGLDELEAPSASAQPSPPPQQERPQAGGFQAQFLQSLMDDVDSLKQELTALSEEVDDELDDLSEEVAAIRSQREQHVAKIANDLQRIEGRVQELETAADEQPDIDDVQATAAEARQELADLRQRVDTLADRHRDVEATQEDLAAAQADLEDTQQDFAARIEREFDDIETIFDSILGDVDDLDSRVDEWITAYRSDMQVLQERIETQNHLAELRQEANAKGVNRGVCDGCGDTVSLALLSTPNCPSCGQLFGGIKDTKIPFRKPVLRAQPDAATAIDPDDDGDSGVLEQ